MSSVLAELPEASTPTLPGRAASENPRPQGMGATELTRCLAVPRSAAGPGRQGRQAAVQANRARGDLGDSPAADGSRSVFIVFGRIAQLPSDGLPYFIFSYAGLLGWNLFSSTLSKTSGCLVGNSQLVSKIYFPRLVLPLSAVPSVLIDFGVALAMMVILMLSYHVHPTLGIVLLPLWVAMLLMLSLGVGLSTAALMVSYRDVGYILPVITQILMYASPIAYGLTYALKRIPLQYQNLYLMNPLAAPLEAFRASLLGTPWPPMHALAYSAAASMARLPRGCLQLSEDGEKVRRCHLTISRSPSAAYPSRTRLHTTRKNISPWPRRSSAD